MKINIENIIEFFDNSIRKRYSKYSNAMTILLGEEFSSYCFKLYLEEKCQNTRVVIHDIPCNRPGRSGKRLDRWIQVINNHDNIILYQAEIKTWSSNGIVGKPISLTTDIDSMNTYGDREWKMIWDSVNNKFKLDQIGKVLTKMTPKSDISQCTKHESLLIYWSPIFNSNINSIEDGIISKQSVENCDFPEVTVFSVSMFLRYLYKRGDREIEITDSYFPRLYGTLEHLNKIIIK